jgi:ABC-2 type transport system permease protein
MHHEANSFFSSPENIKNIMALHAQLIQQPRQKITGPTPYVVYMLKNGKYQVRRYTLDENQYAPLLKPIYESMEYKKAKYPIVAQNPEDIKWIQINDNRMSNKPLVLADSPEMREFMALFQEEVRSMTFEEMRKQTNDYVYLQVTDVNDKYYHYGFRKDFESMVTWLQAKGHYENLILQPKDIEYAVLKKESVGINGNAGNEAGTVEIKDPEILKELLTISETSHDIYERVPIYMNLYIRGPYGRHSYSAPLFTKNIPVSDGLKHYLEALSQS